jgi:hypothetical protein
MKNVFFRVGMVAILSLLSSSVCAESIRVPAFTAYSEPDHDGVEFSEKSGITQWKNPAIKILWFGQFKNVGKLDCSVVMRLAAGAPCKLRLSVDGQSHESQATGASAPGPVTVRFGDFDIKEPGYRRFQLESLNASGEPLGDIEALVLEGDAVRDSHFNLKERRNAASVHLAYPVSKGTNVAAFYCEMTAIDDPLNSYYMACGWHRGYFGMQVNGPSERRIIFSVWDSGGEAADRKKVADTNRVTLLAKGKDVFSGDFGNEGTGGHSHLKYAWKTGDMQRFLVTAQQTNATFTIFSGYYFHPDKKAWFLISSWKAPREGGFLRGLYSFSENFWGNSGHLRRKALYGNQWIRTDKGQWLELITASFSHDPTGKSDRLDRFMGIENGQFFLSHGGFVDGFTAFGDKFTRPASGNPPVIELPN